MRIMFALFALCLIAAQCEKPPPEPPPQPVVTDGGTVADVPAACDHLRELGCREGSPTPAGQTCEEVMSNIETTGYSTTMPACIAKIATCADMSRCVYTPK